MKNKILFGLLFSFVVSAYCQNNAEIKLIQSRVILKNTGENFYGDNYKLYDYLPSLNPESNIYYTMGSGKLDSLARNAYDLAMNGKIIVYDPFNVEIRGTDVHFLTILSPGEIYNYYNSSDTTQVQYPYPPYDIKDTVITKVFDPANVVAIDFYETWTINTKTLNIKKKIIAICPIMMVHNAWTDEFLGLLPLFWIKM